MSLVVETGAGIANADSFLSLADANAYHELYGPNVSFLEKHDDVKEVALRTATRYLNIVYQGRWTGRKSQQTQSLAWPRSGSRDADGWLILPNVVPQCVKDATAELALKHLTEENGLLPDTDASDAGVKRESVSVGSISSEVEYQGSRSTAKRFRVVENLLSALIFSTDEVERA